jgi:flagellar biosynthesis protein FlhB
VPESIDHESRTEEATEKKVNDTIEKGNIPYSREIATLTSFLCFLILANFVICDSATQLTRSLSTILANAGQIHFRNGADTALYLSAVSVETGRFLLPFFLGFMCSGILASAMQGVPRIIYERIAPNLDRISLVGGAKRLLGSHAVIEFVRASAKIVIAIMATSYALLASHSGFVDAMRMEPRFLGEVGLKMLIDLTAALCAPLAVIAIADVLWTRFKWRRDIRMSRHEVKEEIKQAQGDPIVKAKLRSLALDRSRKRMIAAVPKATFVIANPTHYALALRYLRSEGGAPLVVAKGKDLIALKIREVAEQHGIPVLEERALVRSMFDLVEVDRMIPSEFYRPIAELIHFLDLKGKARSAR